MNVSKQRSYESARPTDQEYTAKGLPAYWRDSWSANIEIHILWPGLNIMVEIQKTTDDIW